jgi:Tfp pilus assembly protein PilN
MTTQTTVVGTPTLPRVNLLPPEIAEARTLQQFRLGAGGAVVLAFLAVGGLYVQAHGKVAGAQSALDASTAQTGRLTTQQTQLQGVTGIKNQVVSAQATLSSALAPQILWSHYLQDMSVALAGNYWFTNLALSSGGTAATSASANTAASPLSDGTAIGGVLITGKAVTHNDVAKLLAALAKEKGLSHPVFTSSAEDSSPLTGTTTRLVTFSVSASVDASGKPTAVTPTSATAVTGTGSSPTTTTPAGH